MSTLLATLAPGSVYAEFGVIRVGDVDGLGWGAGAGQTNACGFPVNIDGLGVLTPPDSLPDIDGNGAVGAPADNFDNRSAGEASGTSVTGFGFSQAAPTSGSEFTDRTISSDAFMTLDFHVDTGDIEPGTPLYLNAVIGDLDNDQPQILVTRVDSTQDTRPLLLQQNLTVPANGCNDGLLQDVTLPLEFDDVFIAEMGGWRGRVGLQFRLPGEPLVAIDYAEISRIPSVPRCAEPPSNLVAWYPFDFLGSSIPKTPELIAGLDGSAQHDAVTVPAGRVGGALQLDGLLDAVWVAPNPAFDAGVAGISFDAWLWIDPAGAGGPVVSRLTDGLEQIAYSLAVAGVQGSRELVFLIDDGVAMASYVLDADAAISDGTWNHVAATLAEAPSGGFEAEFWVNGVSAGRAQGGSGNVAASPAQGELRIGSYVPAGADPPSFQGLIDELEIYQGLISPEEVGEIHTAGAFGKCRCAQVDRRLRAWWRAEGTLEDALSSQNAGIALVGGAGYVAAGRVGQAFSFDGASGTVRLPDVGPDTGSFAVDAWIRFTGASVGAIEPILDKRSVTGRGYFLYLANGVLTLSLQDDDGGVPTVVASAGPSLADGDWHHVAAEIIRSGGQVGRLFIDGTPAKPYFDTSVLTGSLASGRELIVGSSYDAVPSFFEGQVDEIEYWAEPESLTSLPFANVLEGIAAAGARGKCPPVAAVEVREFPDPPPSKGGNVVITFPEAEITAFIPPGLFPGAVAVEIALAVNSSPAAQAIGVSAQVVGTRVIFLGGAAVEVSSTDTGVYLARLGTSELGPVPQVPTLQGSLLAVLCALLAATGMLALVRSAAGEPSRSG